MSTSTTSGPGTIQMQAAIVQDRYGATGVLHSAQVPVPTPGDDEVLVRVHAAGVARSTWHLMTGKPWLLRPFFGLRRPRNPTIPGDVAGTVVSVGGGVTRFAVGDEVYGFGAGAFAEHSVALERKLAHKPVNLSFAEAATVPVSALTALQALRDAGRIQPGQRVLVIGASGGVGSWAVKLATAYGAEVTGVASGAKLEAVRSFGATHVIDYRTEDWSDGSHHYDLILDIAGNPRLSRLAKALAPGGTAVLVGGEEGGDFSGGTIHRQLLAALRSLFGSKRITGSLNKENADDLEHLTALLEAGTVTPPLERTWPLDRAAEAVQYLEDGHVRGKVAVTV